MKEEMIIEMLKKTGVILEGHFLLTSGRHSNRFLLCSQLQQHPQLTEQVCRLMAEPFWDKGVETVIGPAMGGVILSYEVARALGARAIFTEPLKGKMILKRGFRIEEGEKVLVVEDAVTTGGSVQKVIDLLKSCKATIVGVSIVVDRSGGAVNFGLPQSALVSMQIDSYQPQDCPLCRSGLPLQKPKG
jgi:orotate phosphoribosyltransferase